MANQHSCRCPVTVINNDKNSETKISALINKALLYKLKIKDDSKAEEAMKLAVKEALEVQDAQLLLTVKQLARDHKINLL